MAFVRNALSVGNRAANPVHSSISTTIPERTSGSEVFMKKKPRSGVRV